jgi:hypothetical protein
MLDPVGVAEAEITGKIRTHGVGVEHDRVDQRRERRGQRGLARSRQAHDQDLAHQCSSRNGPGALMETMAAASSRLGPWRKECSCIATLFQAIPREHASSHAMRRRSLIRSRPSRLALASCDFNRNVRSRRKRHRPPAKDCVRMALFGSAAKAAGRNLAVSRAITAMMWFRSNCSRLQGRSPAQRQLALSALLTLNTFHMRKGPATSWALREWGRTAGVRWRTRREEATTIRICGLSAHRFFRRQVRQTLP